MGQGVEPNLATHQQLEPLGGYKKGYVPAVSQAALVAKTDVPVAQHGQAVEPGFGPAHTPLKRRRSRALQAPEPEQI
jgi:hypothetical protein